MSYSRPASSASSSRPSTPRSSTPAPSHSTLPTSPKASAPPSLVVNVQNSPSMYSFGIPSHLSWSPATTDERTLVEPALPWWSISSPVAPFGTSGGQSADNPYAQQRSDAHAWPGPLPLSRLPQTPSSPASTHPLRSLDVHPALEPGRIWIDLAHTPSLQPGAPNYHQCMPERAFAVVTPHAPSYTIIRFPGQPHWAVTIPNPYGMTVYTLLFHITSFLGEPDAALQAAMRPRTSGPGPAPLRQQVGQVRLREMVPAAFHVGMLRIDMLGRARMFMGLMEDTRSEGWIVRLGEVCN